MSGLSGARWRRGVARIREIVAWGDPYPAPVPILCFALVSGAAARFFAGGLMEIGAAAGIGVIVGVLSLTARRRREYARVLEFVAGMVAALLAMLLGSWVALHVQTVVLGGVIFLVPGLTLTMAVTELATRNLVSGTARLMGALTILVSIGFGVAVGQKIGAMAGLAPIGAGRFACGMDDLARAGGGAAGAGRAVPGAVAGLVDHHAVVGGIVRGGRVWVRRCLGRSWASWRARCSWA